MLIYEIGSFGGKQMHDNNNPPKKVIFYK